MLTLPGGYGKKINNTKVFIGTMSGVLMVILKQ